MTNTAVNHELETKLMETLFEELQVPMQLNMPVGPTGYLDQMTVDQMSERVIKGYDAYGRMFISMIVEFENCTGRGKAVMTAHERYGDGNASGLWVVAARSSLNRSTHRVENPVNSDLVHREGIFDVLTALLCEDEEWYKLRSIDGSDWKLRLVTSRLWSV